MRLLPGAQRMGMWRASEPLWKPSRGASRPYAIYGNLLVEEEPEGEYAEDGFRSSTRAFLRVEWSRVDFEGTTERRAGARRGFGPDCRQTGPLRPLARP
jgi:hypothetical protein